MNGRTALPAFAAKAARVSTWCRFSCTGRGFCPSCGGRRMTERAAHLVDEVVPRVPVRQWTPHHLSSGNFSTLLGVVERAGDEHGHEDADGAINDSAQGPSVCMTALA